MVIAMRNIATRNAWVRNDWLSCNSTSSPPNLAATPAGSAPSAIHCFNSATTLAGSTPASTPAETLSTRWPSMRVMVLTCGAGRRVTKLETGTTPFGVLICSSLSCSRFRYCCG